MRPAQQEMPFAVVDRRAAPAHACRRTFIFLPDALEVFLDAFEGPLDLLLYLIKRQNLDILEHTRSPRSPEQYTRVRGPHEGTCGWSLPAEYLVMAAMLAEIKSRMLLPRPVAAEEDEEDPRAELVRRLQEYERFKKAAEDLDALPRLERDTFPAQAEMCERKVVEILPEITLKELLMSFREVLARAEMFAHHHIQREPLSVRQRMSDVLDAVSSDAFASFDTLFRPEEGRLGVVVTFIALLELLRERLIELVQAEPFAAIHVRALGPVADSAANESGGIEAAADDTGAVA